jgi:hypothetical protein
MYIATNKQILCIYCSQSWLVPAYVVFCRGFSDYIQLFSWRLGDWSKLTINLSDFKQPELVRDFKQQKLVKHSNFCCF